MPGDLPSTADSIHMHHGDVLKAILYSITGCLLATGLPCHAAPLSLSPTPPAEQAISPMQPHLGKPAVITPMPGQAVSPDNPIKLQVHKQGIPANVLFRQLQPKRYSQFNAKMNDVKRSLKAALTYLDSLEGRAPAVQRLSAFGAESWLDWTQLETVILPEETGFQSYRMAKEAVMALRELNQFWITAEQVRPVFRGTTREADMDEEVILLKREKLRTALHALDTLEQQQQALQAEFPRGY